MSIELDLSPQVAVVTGSGSGIGEAIARLLAQAGAAVAITSEPISLIWRRRMPGIVAMASLCTASSTSQMERLRSSLSLKVSIMDAPLTWGIW